MSVFFNTYDYYDYIRDDLQQNQTANNISRIRSSFCTFDDEKNNNNNIQMWMDEHYSYNHSDNTYDHEMQEDFKVQLCSNKNS